MWELFDLEMVIAEPGVCGGRPRSDQVCTTWIAQRTATDAAHRRMKEKPPGGNAPRELGEVAADAADTLDPLAEDADAKMERIWVGFSRDDKGLFVRGSNIRAHMKYAAGVLGRRLKSENGFWGMPQCRNFKMKVADSVYIVEERVYLRDESGKPITRQPDHRDHAMQVMTPLGPRTCLKRVDVVHPCTIRATVEFLPGDIKPAHLRAIFEYGSKHGFNQDRSLQFGRYAWTLTKKD